MKMRFHLPVLTLAAVFTLPGLGMAAPSGPQICKKMIADGRGGGMTRSDCLCLHRVADAVLDDDIKTLMFDAWYNGTNNMQTMELLPNPQRVKQQLRTLQRAMKSNCGK